jgi:low affinity Fe/Cu permease
MNEFFRRFAQRSSQLMGSSWCFLLAVMSIVIWAVTGPMFRYSDTWQLAINTGTTIVTFLMVFLIQNSQNRDTRALHIKLDEMIRVKHEARNSLLNLEDMTDEELDRLQAEFKRLHERDLRRRGGVAADIDGRPIVPPPVID